MWQVAVESPDQIAYRQLCRKLDASTLLALLPELRFRVDKARTEFEHMRRSAERRPEDDAAVYEALNDAAMAWDACRADAPEAAEIIQETIDNLRRQAAENADKSAEMHEGAIMVTFAWLAACHMNILVVQEELESRGLLPVPKPLTSA